jgi:L,D-peptidoglycan transpeptidase YkuD (ErfK/YbiS/YcfS/YnhG family)
LSRVFTATSAGWMDIGGNGAGPLVRCALGKGGVVPASAKREGDGASPAGTWPIRRVLWRADRATCPTTALPALAIQPEDGWCDDPADRFYNRPVSHPWPTSAERLWREDSLYDVIVVLGHNDSPVVPGAGSAIFLHLAREDHGPTEGCIALARADLGALLAVAAPGDAVAITPAAPAAL